MGIHDRPYYRQPPGQSRGMPSFGGRGPGGIPHPRTWSITLWLIVINTAIFLLGSFPPLNAPATLEVARIQRTDVDPSRLQNAIELRTVELPPAPAAPGVVRYPLVEQVQSPAGIPQDFLLFDRDTNTLYEVLGEHRVYRNPSLGILGGYGHFSTRQGFTRLEVWRLVTFQFLHADFMHIAFNMFGLWIFGGIVERALGKKRFLAFYLSSGIAGALLYLILNGAGALNIPLPGALNVSVNTPLIGASAGVFAVIVACAKLAPNAPVYLLLIPVPLKMKFVAYGYVALAAANLIIFKGQNQGGDAAHVGGAIAGFFLIRNTHLLNDFFDVFGKGRTKRGKPAVTKVSKRAKGPKPEEVDRILAKVSTDGLHSLTDKEKELLRKASRAP